MDLVLSPFCWAKYPECPRKDPVREYAAEYESVAGSSLEEGTVAVPDLKRNLRVAWRENFDLFFAHDA